MFGVYWHFKPLESLHSLRMESFNEVTVIVLNDFMICFTDVVPSSQERNDIGFIYIAVIFVNLAVHLFLLLVATAVNGKKQVKKCYLRIKQGKFKCCCLGNRREVAIALQSEPPAPTSQLALQARMPKSSLTAPGRDATSPSNVSAVSKEYSGLSLSSLDKHGSELDQHKPQGRASLESQLENAGKSDKKLAPNYDNLGFQGMTISAYQKKKIKLV